MYNVTEPIIFGITVDVQYSVISSDLIVASLDSMNIPLALWIAGCEDLAMEYISSEGKHRILQAQGPVGTVEFSQIEPWGLEGRSKDGIAFVSLLQPQMILPLRILSSLFSSR
jgi:hypothetical protein